MVGLIADVDLIAVHGQHERVHHLAEHRRHRLRVRRVGALPNQIANARRIGMLRVAAVELIVGLTERLERLPDLTFLARLETREGIATNVFSDEFDRRETRGDNYREQRRTEETRVRMFHFNADDCSKRLNQATKVAYVS